MLGLHPGFIYLLCDLGKVIGLSVREPPHLYRGVVTMVGLRGAKSPLSPCGVLSPSWLKVESEHVKPLGHRGELII